MTATKEHHFSVMIGVKCINSSITEIPDPSCAMKQLVLRDFNGCLDTFNRPGSLKRVKMTKIYDLRFEKNETLSSYIYAIADISIVYEGDWFPINIDPEKVYDWLEFWIYDDKSYRTIVKTLPLGPYGFDESVPIIKDIFLKEATIDLIRQSTERFKSVPAFVMNLNHMGIS